MPIDKMSKYSFSPLGKKKTSFLHLGLTAHAHKHTNTMTAGVVTLCV